MTDNTLSPTTPRARRNAVSFSFLALIGLAALGLPRVILHDLHLIEPQGLLTWILAVGPVAVWVTVAVVRRVPNPFLTVLVIGALFGLMLVLTHQLLWDVAFGGQLPAVGGGELSTVLPRLFAIPSGLITGAMIGAIGGLIAWGLQSASRRRSSRTDPAR